MSKKQRKVVGAIIRGDIDKEGNKRETPYADRIEIFNDITLKKSQILNLESKEMQLKSLKDAQAAGKLSEEFVQEKESKLANMAKNVRFHVVTYVDKE